VVDIYRIKFPKEKLREFSSEERSLFFLLGYAANQIAVFKKLVVFATNHSHDDRHVQSVVEGAQTQILVRHFIGVVSEAWELVNKRFIQKPVGREYQARLHPNGKEALAKLKSHFGGSNILNTVRNQFAFHHPYDAEVDAGFELAAASPEYDDEWNWYLANENINTFYFVSDVVVIHGMLSAIGEKDAVVAQKRILGELNLVADQFILFASFCLHAILSKYFAPEIIAEVCEKVADAPQSLDVGLPFYIEPPSEERLIKEGLPIT
jgi:hypothetical protein